MAEYGWPRPIGQAALIGLAGAFIEAVQPHTEADPSAILLQFLTCFGNCVGRTVRVDIDPQRPQHLNLYTVVVGPTGAGRKGTAWAVALRPFAAADPRWVRDRIDPGASTGEGLIRRVQDRVPIYDRRAEPAPPESDIPPIMRGLSRNEPAGRKGGSFRERQIAPAHREDKRLLVLSEEFGRTLRVKARSGNTLWDLLRTLFDRGSAAVTTKTDPITAIDAHVSLVGHITPDELHALASYTAIVNGEFNRILWCCSLMTRSLSRAPAVSPAEENLYWDVHDVLAWGQDRGEPLRLAPEAEELWDALYQAEDEEERPELVARGHALLGRLAGVYAALARSPVVATPHLLAAAEVWRYSRESALHLFAGTPDSAALSQVPREELRFRKRQARVCELIRAAPGGLTRRELWDKTNRNYPVHELQAILDTLMDEGRVRVIQDGECHWIAEG